MEFARPGLLWLLCLLPAWLAWSIRRPLRLREPETRLRHPAIAARAGEGRAAAGKTAVPRCLAFAALLLAAAQPRQPGEWIPPPAIGRDIALVIDISGSMNIEAARGVGRTLTRLDLVKRVLSEFVAARRDDRFALLVFGSGAALLTPPTLDREHVLRQIARLQIGALGDYSAVGDALGLAVRSVAGGRQRPALIFVSDGDPANAGSLHPAEALAVAVESGVAIHALQVGPGRRLADGGDDDPQPALADIARLSGGRHAVIGGVEEARRFLRLVDVLEPSLRPPPEEREMREWYPLPLALAIALLALVRRREGA